MQRLGQGIATWSSYHNAANAFTSLHHCIENDAKTLYQNLKKAILGIDKKDQETLQIFGLVNIAEQDYMEYPLPIAPLS